MGHAARRNETAQAAQRGELLSRQSIMGAMDHALERHADALRLLEARIKAQSERIDYLMSLLPKVAPVPLIDSVLRDVMYPKAEYTKVDASVQRLSDTVEAQSIVSKQQQHESAKPCGCDPGAGWICLEHAKEKNVDAD